MFGRLEGKLGKKSKEKEKEAKGMGGQIKIFIPLVWMFKIINVHKNE